MAASGAMRRGEAVEEQPEPITGRFTGCAIALVLRLACHRALIDNPLYVIRSVNKIGAEPCEQLPLFSGLSFRAEYCAFGGLIAQPL
jgi:hypothetical protein